MRGAPARHPLRRADPTARETPNRSDPCAQHTKQSLARPFFLEGQKPQLASVGCKIAVARRCASLAFLAHAFHQAKRRIVDTRRDICAPLRALSVTQPKFCSQFAARWSCRHARRRSERSHRIARPRILQPSQTAVKWSNPYPRVTWPSPSRPSKDFQRSSQSPLTKQAALVRTPSRRLFPAVLQGFLYGACTIFRFPHPLLPPSLPAERGTLDPSFSPWWRNSCHRWECIL